MIYSVEKSIEYASANRSRFLDQLCDLISIPSISTDPNRKLNMQSAADWLVDYLEKIGMQNVQTFPPETHPIIYADYLSAGLDAPTMLIYGHYDVQPAEPVDKWATSPFTPTIIGENLYARGATDMKGQVMASIFAIEALLSQGPLPINIKFMLEGEEEIGSPNLALFIEEHKQLLACDFCLNPDTGMLGPDTPTITYGLRGLAYFELRIYGPKNDLHSGVFGGAINNPAQVLAEVIAGMHTPDGTITLPGFYDSVRPLENEEREELARIGVTEDLLKERTGVPALWGEPAYSAYERISVRPTLEIHGLYSGFIGEGGKTIIPSYAMAKISMRLVPDQRPDQVQKQLLAYLEQHAPPTICWELFASSQNAPSISDRNSPWVQAMSDALFKVWGSRPLFKREGGSVPVVTQLQDILGIESVNTGFSLPDDNMHGPNEKLHIPTWVKGIEALIRLVESLTAV